MARCAPANALQLIGELNCNVSFKDKHFSVICYLTDCSVLNLIDLEWIEEFHLCNVSLNSVFNKFKLASDIEKFFIHTLKTKFSNIFFFGVSASFLQIEANEESKELLTINTHRGLFKFNRLSFAVKSTPATFQQTVDSMLNGLSLHLLMISLLEAWPRMNSCNGYFLFVTEFCKMCIFRMSIKYLGFIYEKNAWRPGKYLSLKKNIPEPTNITTLCTSLNHLLKKNVQWNWSQKCFWWY